MSHPLSQAYISRRAVLRSGMLSLATALWSLSSCGSSVPSPSGHNACDRVTPSSSDPISIQFLYSTEKDAWLQDAKKVFEQTNLQCGGRQIHIDLQDVGSWDLVSQILNNSYPHVVACSPASELELSRLDDLWKKKNGQFIVNHSTPLEPRSLVQSPLVFAIWKEFADVLMNHYHRIDWDTLYQALQLPNGWIDLGLPKRGPQIHLGQTLPTESNSGLMAITLMACAYLKQNNKPQSTLTVEEIMHDTRLWDYVGTFDDNHVNVYGKSSGTYWDRVIDLGPAQYAIIFTYESLVLLYNQHRMPDQPQMEMFYPEQNVLNDHPFAILDNHHLPNKQLQEQQAAALAFRTFLLEKDQQKAALRYGFRPGDFTYPLADPGKNDPDNPFDQLKPTNKVSSLSPAHALDDDINYINPIEGNAVNALITQWSNRYPDPNSI